MNSLADLEEQIVLLNSLSKVSGKTLDAFADVSHSISVRAHQIYRDVKPWEVSLVNIEGTIDEISKAAKCYHPPPVLKAVMAQKDVHPESIVKCADYLVYSDEYLTSHPPNEYGESIRAHLGVQLERIVEVSENFIRNAFTAALKRPPNAPIVIKEIVTNSIIKNPNALNGVPEVLSRLAQHFNRTEVVQVEVKQLLDGKLKTAVNTCFNDAYAAEDARRNVVKTSAHNGSQWYHYQRGEHCVLKVSLEARGMIQEVSDCVNTYIIQPMDEDFDVLNMPGELATSVFDMVLDKARTAIHFDQRYWRDPTSMFLASRGQGIGLFPGIRTFRDIIFIGLDILEEMWKWKLLIHDLPGENNEAEDHVDQEVDLFIQMVRDLLQGYADATGGLSKSLLKERARQGKRFEWFPALDCTAHESSTNLLYFQKTLFSSYFGALKMALFGSVLDSSSDHYAMKEVEDYFARCVMGHMEDITTMGLVAKELLQEMDQATRRKSNSSKKKKGGVPEGHGNAFISVEVFVINNALFLNQSYMKAKCFTRRVIPMLPSPDGVSAKHAFLPLVVQQAADYLQDEVTRSVEEFGTEWEKCFLDMPKEVQTAAGSIASGGVPMKKSLTLLLKNWYTASVAALGAVAEGCKGEAVMDGEVRRQLIRKACETVEEKFNEMNEVVDHFLGGQELLRTTAPMVQDILSILRTIF